MSEGTQKEPAHRPMTQPGAEGLSVEHIQAIGAVLQPLAQVSERNERLRAETAQAQQEEITKRTRLVLEQERHRLRTLLLFGGFALAAGITVALLGKDALGSHLVTGIMAFLAGVLALRRREGV